MAQDFDDRQQHHHQMALALARVATAVRTAAWQQSGSLGLTPTQASILTLLQTAGRPLRVSEVAQQLGIKPATASDSIGSLVEKRLVRRGLVRGDARAVAISLTGQGQQTAEQLSQSTGYLTQAMGEITPEEQQAMQRGLLKLLHALQEEGRLGPGRLCLTCRFFRPYSHPGSGRPHHCTYFDAAFTDAGLRVECSAYQAAGPDLAAAVWHRFLAGEVAGRGRQ